MSNLTILVPTRSRPQNVLPIIHAWHETKAFDDGATLCFIVDEDDPTADQYRSKIFQSGQYGRSLFAHWMPQWKPLVPKLNHIAAGHTYSTMVGFAGDDHLPRTPGWAARYQEELTKLGTGIVSCPDGLRSDDLPTQWAMTADIVSALGRMVPAPVAHLYCDNSIRDLGSGAHCYRWLDDVLIEHMHPLAGKVASDEQYRAVNSAEQYSRDRAAYARWTYLGMRRDAELVKGLKEAPRGE